MPAGDQPPTPGPDRYRRGDEQWSHFDDTTSHLDFRIDDAAADQPTERLRPYRGGHGGAPVPWWRHRTTVVLAASFLPVLLIGTVAFIALRPTSTPAALESGPTTSTSATPSGSPSPSPSPTASPTPSPTPPPTTTRPAANPVPTAPPTQPPPPAEQPPAPPPPAPPACTPTYDGENAPFSQVRAALEAAASKRYWVGVRKPVEYIGDGTDVAVPLNFVKAVAYQESGWQSAIRACDGGMGTMQVMSGTIDHINLRFGMNYSIPLDLQENTEAGVNYLQWLYMYFGLYYYNGNFDDPYLEAPVGPNGQMLMLIDAVVSAYNVGPAALERESGGQYYLAVPNWDYVNAVWHFAMEDCPCDDLV